MGFRISVLVAATLLVACAPVEAPYPAPTQYQLDVGGIDIPSLGKRIDFGRTQNSTVSAMKKLGNSSSEIWECSGNVVAASFLDATVLVFKQNQFKEWSFRGWEKDGRTQGLVCSPLT